MGTFLFNEVIFGPVKSRRLGNSLGINLLPTDCKVCNFDCIYCECGWSHRSKIENLTPSAKIIDALEKKLNTLKVGQIPVDTITFAGNGEPTLHPSFNSIIDATKELRNRFFPNAKVAVLSNATMLHNAKIFQALQKADLNILKLDSAFEETIQLLNKPTKGYSLKKTIELLSQFKGSFILQTMFVKGSINGTQFNNTTNKEIKAWLEVVMKLKPEMVMIYTISRDTPIESIEAIPEDMLKDISSLVESKGIKVMVSQ